jgi:hypothetical protein
MFGPCGAPGGGWNFAGENVGGRGTSARAGAFDSTTDDSTKS